MLCLSQQSLLKVEALLSVKHKVSKYLSAPGSYSQRFYCPPHPTGTICNSSRKYRALTWPLFHPFPHSKWCLHLQALTSTSPVILPIQGRSSIISLRLNFWKRSNFTLPPQYKWPSDRNSRNLGVYKEGKCMPKEAWYSTNSYFHKLSTHCFYDREKCLSSTRIAKYFTNMQDRYNLLKLQMHTNPIAFTKFGPLSQAWAGKLPIFTHKEHHPSRKFF